MSMKWKGLWKIAVSGSRFRYPNLDYVTTYLSKYIRKKFDGDTERVVFITGNALGVDDVVETWCRKNGIKNLVIPARWLELHRPAGPRRNQHMVDLADEFFAFWSGDQDSRGTLNAIIKAKRKQETHPDFRVTVLLPWELRKELGMDPIPIVKLPSKQRMKKAGITRKNIRKIVEEADVVNWFKKKERKFRKGRK